MEQEKRRGQDRRKAPTRPFTRHAFFGRRSSARRKEEGINYYVDRYNRRLLLVIVGILFLCIIDAVMTLHLIRIGGREANPFMLVLLKKNIPISMVVKYLMTALCLSFILIHKNFRIFKKLSTEFVLYLVLGIYLSLVAFELISFYQINRIYSGP